MSLTTALASFAALLAGTAGAVGAYQLAAPDNTGTSSAVEAAAQDTGTDRPRFAPCKKPAKLKDGKCVTSATRTVVVAGTTLGASAPGSGGLPAAPSGSDDQNGSDDARRDFDDDELVAVEDDDFDDDFDDSHGTHTRTRDASDASDFDTGGTSTRTRTGD